VEEPPATPIVLTIPYTPAAPCDCDEIPLVAHEGMNAGSYTDKGVEPKQIYYYKVLSVDQNGNESKLDEAIPYSTYTFKISGPAQPQIISVSSLADSCGLLLQWTPEYDGEEHLGYVVFRSSSQNGIYRQISPLIATSQYNDEDINKGVFYWYKVQSLDPDGRPSRLSDPYKAKFE
jgi:fibronectin type 3 domain-containing protein